MKEQDKKRDPMPPPDATPEEIGEFWDMHSLADYWDETEEVEFQVNLKSERDQTQSDETEFDLPTTTDEVANPALDTVTDLALDSTIPAPIRRNVFKALDRLGSALIDIPIGALERRSSERRVESEARIKITEAVNAQIVQQIKVDPDFSQRASNTFAKKILREQYNLEKILGFATDVLKEKQYEDSKDSQADKESEKTIDDDWFNIFEKEASQKSTEEVQHRFARVLAGEIEKPGAYSIRAVKILGEIDQYAAALFEKLCSAAIIVESRDDGSIFEVKVPSLLLRSFEAMLNDEVAQNALSKYGLGFEQLNVLNEHGLILSGYNLWRTYNVSRSSENGAGSLKLRHQGKYWDLSLLSDQDEDQLLKLPGIVFSRSGCELLSIVDQYPMPEYTEDLKKFFADQNLRMVEALNQWF